MCDGRRVNYFIDTFYLEFFVRVPEDFSSTEDGPKDNPDISRSVTQVALPATKRLVAMTPWTWKVLTWSQRQNLSLILALFQRQVSLYLLNLCIILNRQ